MQTHQIIHEIEVTERLDLQSTANFILHNNGPREIGNFRKNSGTFPEKTPRKNSGNFRQIIFCTHRKKSQYFDKLTVVSSHTHITDKPLISTIGGVTTPGQLWAMPRSPFELPSFMVALRPLPSD